MIWIKLVGATTALALSLAAAAQHGQHTQSGARPVTPKVEKAAPVATGAESGYTSAFTGYRRFILDEPLKDWRAANDEVREAGGHAGLMKGGHGHPGAEKPASPEGKK